MPEASESAVMDNPVGHLEGITEKKKPETGRPAWRKAVAAYEKPSTPRSVWQICNTLIPLIALWVISYLCFESYKWVSLLLAIPAAGFLVRGFIILHDCGHGSFFKSRRLNDAVGMIFGVITFTPYYYWRHDHAVHHAGAGDLERRDVGDIWTLTVKEYFKLSTWERFKYRLYRNPIVLFVIGPSFIFLIKYRFVYGKANRRERYSVYLTNLGMLAVAGIVSYFIGWQAYLFIQLPMTMIAASVGVWMFYVQHQFEDVYWEHHQEWDFVAAALDGSSFYKLPKVLQWFTGNIGFHHIHHLSPRIPNYYLEKCYNDTPLFQEIEPITLFSSFKTMTYRLWDEESRKLISFAPLRGMQNAQ